MHCPHCLYDLSHTDCPRCPECGRAFNRKNPETYLQTGTRWAALEFQFACLMRNGVDGLFGGSHKFCRECFGSLEGAVNEKCPICGKWFRFKDRSTYRTSDHSFVRLFERFKHICIGRGLMLPIPIAAYGAFCIFTRTAFLPGANGTAGFAADVMDLTGGPAVFMGAAWLGLTIALHCRYFWGRVDPVWRFAELGFMAGLFMLAAGWITAIAWAVCATMQ